MSKLSLSFETTFAVYEINELIGQGGSGRVYGGVDPDGTQIALKVLSDERASSDKRRRLKNEIGFLARNRHKNIVTLLDHGVARSGKVQGPFYVMKRYSSSLRPLMGKLDADKAMALFSQILDGVEAAHLLGAVHRDLKPENVLYDPQTETIALADFGIASFTEELLTTAVDTAPQQRLANFQYAAPEQRTPGRQISMAADIYALGLMMNEIFTGQVPHGTDFKAIGEVHADMAFLDPIVTQMLKQAPGERPASIGGIKGLIQRYKAEAVTQQRLEHRAFNLQHIQPP